MEEQSDSGNTRMKTRAKNANTHPGITAMEPLRMRQAPRDREVIQKEKDAKKGRKEAKAHAQALKATGEELVARLDAEKDAIAEENAMPRERQQKGASQKLKVPSKPQPSAGDDSDLESTRQEVEAKTKKVVKVTGKKRKVQNNQSDAETQRDTREPARQKKKKKSSKNGELAPPPKGKRPRTPSVQAKGSDEITDSDKPVKCVRKLDTDPANAPLRRHETTLTGFEMGTDSDSTEDQRTPKAKAKSAAPIEISNDDEPKGGFSTPAALKTMARAEKKC